MTRKMPTAPTARVVETWFGPNPPLAAAFEEVPNAIGASFIRSNISAETPMKSRFKRIFLH